MKIECCGKNVRTPYCPNCGKGIGSSGSLSSYLLHELDNAERHMERFRKRHDAQGHFYNEGKISKNKKLLHTQTLKANRIREWIDFIERAEQCLNA